MKNSFLRSYDPEISSLHSPHASIIEETRMEMIGLDKIREAVSDKIVTPQKNTAAIAIVALAVAGIALFVAIHKGK